MPLYQPSNITPSTFAGLSGGVVNVNDPLVISWTVNGNSAMTAFSIEVYQNSTEASPDLAIPKTALPSPGFYGTDEKGNPQTFTYAPGGTWAELSNNVMENGKEYLLQITQYYAGPNFSEYSVTQSSESVFITRSSPTLYIRNDFPSPVQTIQQTFSAFYSAYIDDPVTWVRWVLTNNTTEKIVDDTQEINTPVLEYTAKGLLSDNDYSLTCTVESSSGLTVSAEKSFSVSYDVAQAEGGIQTSCTEDEAILVSWGAPVSIPGTASPASGYSFDQSTKRININAGTTLTWNTVGGESMSFSTPCSVVWSGSVYPTIAPTSELSLEYFSTFAQNETGTMFAVGFSDNSFAQLFSGDGFAYQNYFPAPSEDEIAVEKIAFSPEDESGRICAVAYTAYDPDAGEDMQIIRVYQVQARTDPTELSFTLLQKSGAGSFYSLEIAETTDENNNSVYLCLVAGTDTNIVIAFTSSGVLSTVQIPTNGEGGKTACFVTDNRFLFSSAGSSYSPSVVSGYTVNVDGDGTATLTDYTEYGNLGQNVTGMAYKSPLLICKSKIASATVYNLYSFANPGGSSAPQYIKEIVSPSGARGNVHFSPDGSRLTIDGGNGSLNNSDLYSVDLSYRTVYYAMTFSENMLLATDSLVAGTSSYILSLYDISEAQRERTLFSVGDISVSRAFSAFNIYVSGSVADTIPFQSANAIVEVKISAELDGNSGYVVAFKNGTEYETVTRTLPFVQSSITSVTMTGAQSADYLFITSDPDYDITQNNYTPIFVGQALFFADFSAGSINAGTFSGNVVTGFALYRVNGDEVTKLGDVPSDTTELKDYGVKSFADYQYRLYYVSDSRYSTPTQSESVCKRLLAYSLIEATEDDEEENVFHVVNVWRFGSNASGGTLTNNYAPQFLENFTQYPSVQYASQMPLSGTLSALLSNTKQNTYADTAEQMQALFDITKSRNQFFLRDRKGNLYMIAISGAITQTVDDNSAILPVTVSVPWQEVGDASGISLIQLPTDPEWNE